MASREIGVPPPGRLELRPKLLLKFAPSTVKLVERPSLPAKLMPLAYGESLVMAARLRLEFGRFIISRLDTLVEAPVFSEPNFVVEATTTTSCSCSAASSRTMSCV